MKTDETYIPVNQSDDLEAAPVIVDVINPVHVTVREEVEDAADEDYNWKQVECAGCVGGVVGCMFFGGLCMSVICATGCVYAARECEEGSFAGDMARSCGSLGIKANKMIRDINEKQHVVEKTKIAATAALSKAKDLNNEYQIVEKTKDCLKSSIKAGIEFSQEHKIVERTSNGARAVITAVAQEIGPASGTTTDIDNNRTNISTEVGMQSEPMHSEGKKPAEN